jgi:hypothetical protein
VQSSRQDRDIFRLRDELPTGNPALRYKTDTKPITHVSKKHCANSPGIIFSPLIDMFCHPRGTKSRGVVPATADYPSTSLVCDMTVARYATSHDGHVTVTKHWSPNLANATSNDGTIQDELTSEHVEEQAIEPDPSKGYDGLCAVCESLNIAYLDSVYGAEGFFLDLGLLIDAASRCKTCKRIFNLRGLREFAGAQFRNTVCVSFNSRPRVNGCCGTLVIKVADRSNPRMTLVTIIAECTAFTNEGDVASLKHDLLPLHTMGTNTSSAESFDIARKWLKDCIEDHQGSHNLRATSFRNRFGQSPFDTGVGPARLIDVFAYECDVQSTGNSSRTHSGPDPGSLPGDEWKRSSRIVDRTDVLDPYLALSYKWGSHPSRDHVTTNANLLARRLHLAEDELPTTFRHAIHIARRLGVRYLWIDAICIIQDSELEKDWLQESEKMGSIFANALLTLFAAGSEHSGEGMFNEFSTHGKKYDDQRIITLHTGSFSNAHRKLGFVPADVLSTRDEKYDNQRIFWPCSTVRSTLHLVPSDMESHSLDYRPHRSDGPLLSRAWCLQEDLLSKCKLYYASDQLYWECDHLAVSEDGLADPEFASSLIASSSLNKVSEPESAVHASRYWYMHVIEGAYSQRMATKATDRLIAVAGLARHAANTIKSRYVAGLWENCVLEGLLWEQNTDHNVKLSKTHCAPSWSWASWQGGTRWRSLGEGHENFVPDCEFVRAHIDLQGNDAYGGVKSGALVLRSKVIEVVIEEEADRPHELRASCEGTRGWALLDEKTTLSDTRFLAVPILDDVSLLVTKNSESHTYRRVGLWRIPSDIMYSHMCTPLDTWGCPAEHLRWRDQILPTVPVTEITIV